MLQTYIPYIPKNSTLINEKIAMDTHGNRVVFFTATGPVYSYKTDDKFAKRLAQGIIVSTGLAKPAELGRALSVSHTTVSRNAETYKKKGPKGFIDDRTSRTPYKFTKAKQRAVKRMLDQGSTMTAAAAKVGVSEGCIRTALRNGVIERTNIPLKPIDDPIDMKGPAIRSQEDINCKSGIAAKRELERILASKGKIEEAKPEFTANESVNYAGALLALPFLADLEYLNAGKNVYGALKKGYYGLQSIFLTFAFMALLRIKTPEQLKKHNPGDFGIILGLDRCPEVKTLRRKLQELGLQHKSGNFMDYLTCAWADQEDDILGFVYIDGHVRPYHGRKHTLPKTHVARRRLCMPATTDFWINGTNCEPLFFVTAEANDSLLSMIDQEIIPELQKLSPDERVTLVFDREGWSPDRFFRWAKSGIDVITYRKGNYKPWPSECFFKVSSHVRGQTVLYELGERSIRLNKKKGWLREVRRLCDNGHQTSVITTRQDLSCEEIARRMFFRWNQENYFRYMREEYGLDHLVSRDVEPANVERMVPNPEKKAMRTERDKLKRKLKNRMEKYGSKTADNDESRCRTVRGFNISNFGLKSEIKRMEIDLENIEKQIKELPNKVMIKEILNEDEIIRLETEKKRLTDTVKMACYRSETELLNVIIQKQCFARDMDEGRSFLKSVFQQSADIVPNDEKAELLVKFHTMSNPRENKALEALCKIVNEKEFIYPGTKLQLVFMAA